MHDEGERETRSFAPAEAATGVAAAFERAVDALTFDPAFAGLEIVERRARRSGGGYEFALVLDRDGGLDVATCERVSSELNGALSGFEERYELFVSSAGLERPLRERGDYVRFRGREAVVTTMRPIDHEYTHRGTLRGLRGDDVLVDVPRRGEVAIPLDAIKSAHLAYDPRADLRREKTERAASRRANDRPERGR